MSHGTVNANWTQTFFSYVGFCRRWATSASSAGCWRDYYATAAVCSASLPPVHAFNRGVTTKGFGSIVCGRFGAAPGTTSFSAIIGFIVVTGVSGRELSAVARSYRGEWNESWTQSPGFTGVSGTRVERSHPELDELKLHVGISGSKVGCSQCRLQIARFCSHCSVNRLVRTQTMVIVMEGKCTRDSHYSSQKIRKTVLECRMQLWTLWSKLT